MEGAVLLETRKLISALCYFSIFFAGFIIPIVIYFITDDPEVKHHAKAAFVSHILPFASLLFLLIAVFTLPTFSGFIIALLLCGVLYAAVTIYNVIQGIRVLVSR